MDAERLLGIAQATEADDPVASADDRRIDRGALADSLLNVARGVLAGERRGQSRWVQLHVRAGSEHAKKVARAPLQRLHADALQTQKAVHNRESASKDDYTIGSEPRVWKGTKAGRWKQRTGEEACRIIFHRPASTMLEVAQSLRPRGSSRHCTDLLFAGCHHFFVKS